MNVDTNWGVRRSTRENVEGRQKERRVSPATSARSADLRQEVITKLRVEVEPGILRGVSLPEIVSPPE